MSLRDEIVEIIETTVYFSRYGRVLLAADDAADLIVDKLRERAWVGCDPATGRRLWRLDLGDIPEEFQNEPAAH